MTPLSRRTVLRGLGVTMCLPLLEAMEARAAAAPPAAAADATARRMAVLYMPNGVNPHAWQPTGQGAQFALSEMLEPLARVKDKLLVLTELMNKHSIEGDGHYVKVAPFLTGTSITRTTGRDLRVGGVSLDQVVAQHLGNLTPLPSLELSIEPPTTYVDTNVGFTALYGSHISWSTPTTPVSRELSPQLAFDRLFRGRSGKAIDTQRESSVLDAILDDARSLRQSIGQSDRLKLEEYFDAVRSVEKRIAFDSARRKRDLLDDPSVRSEVGKLEERIKNWYAVPEGKRGIDHTEQVRLMLDLMVLAFWTDSTRVSTFMFGNEVSGKNFAFLPGVGGGHHQISHHENDKDKLEQYKRIGTWHVAQYAYLLERLDAIKEGDKTLLDNSMVLFASGMKDGNAHSPYNLPIVLGGRAGGSLATGRHLVYDAKTPLCNLYLGMLRRMGVPATAFGDSTDELVGLSDPGFIGAAKKA
jgi:hypothetical protein